MEFCRNNHQQSCNTLSLNSWSPNVSKMKVSDVFSRDVCLKTKGCIPSSTCFVSLVFVHVSFVQELLLERKVFRKCCRSKNNGSSSRSWRRVSSEKKRNKKEEQCSRLSLDLTASSSDSSSWSRETKTEKRLKNRIRLVIQWKKQKEDRERSILFLRRKSSKIREFLVFFISWCSRLSV
jgi:hypothetical protein